eukprot:TRINITY_DN44467_c0_g1_i1.p1 TRINITY_DN44467_c0_g1~~TRINITY_DN44467_c0_g1_i1.p1  ORF type:complete len:492 (-),score=73.83 TRINITY_DN44467_c0_g1_i1:63-1538(-)
MPTLSIAACLLCALSSARANRLEKEFDDRLEHSLEPGSPVESRRDVFSVMNCNTFLLEIRLFGWAGGGIARGKKRNMQQRSDGFVEWFRTLQPKDVPDAVVFNEIFSKAGSSVIKRLCNPEWKRNGPQVLECKDGSDFAAATRVLNPAGRIKISGGVVIMVRRGLEISDFAEEAYVDHDLEDGMSQKGFLRVKVRKHSVGDVWLIGTHTQAWPENKNIRVQQFKQVWKHINEHIPRGERVIVAGDFNTETPELPDMKRELHAESPPITEAGFFMPLRTPLKYSTYGSGAQNAFIHHDAHEFHDMSPHDQIVYVSSQAGYSEPKSMTWQYLPMKSETCYDTNLASSKMTIQVDDLSDHYAVYAELCFGSNCAFTELSGHHGYTGIHRDDQFRCCPGRGMIGDRCFDWADGGIKSDRIGFAPGKPDRSEKDINGYCTKSTYGKTCPIVFGDEGKEVLEPNDLEDCKRKLAILDLPFKLISMDCALGSEKFLQG